MVDFMLVIRAADVSGDFNSCHKAYNRHNLTNEAVSSFDASTIESTVSTSNAD
jgi:hypothetical protein